MIRGDGFFLEVDKLTIADRKVNMNVRLLQSGILDHIPTDTMSSFEHLITIEEWITDELAV